MKYKQDLVSMNMQFNLLKRYTMSQLLELGWIKVHKTNKAVAFLLQAI